MTSKYDFHTFFCNELKKTEMKENDVGYRLIFLGNIVCTTSFQLHF